jgi:hypothetical protein
MSKRASNVLDDMKYRKKSVLTEATQWFSNGDHPHDETTIIETPDGALRSSEGKVVKYFRSLKIPGGRFCPVCGNVMQDHGMLDGPNGEETVCPGDYIVTDRKGNYYVVKASEFEAQYEPYELIAHLPEIIAHPPKG